MVAAQSSGEDGGWRDNMVEVYVRENIHILSQEAGSHSLLRALLQ